MGINMKLCRVCRKHFDIKELKYGKCPRCRDSKQGRYKHICAYKPCSVEFYTNAKRTKYHTLACHHKALVERGRNRKQRVIDELIPSQYTSCHKCSGKGIIIGGASSDKTFKCPECNGTGKLII